MSSFHRLFCPNDSSNWKSIPQRFSKNSQIRGNVKMQMGSTKIKPPPNCDLIKNKQRTTTMCFTFHKLEEIGFGFITSASFHYYSSKFSAMIIYYFLETLTIIINKSK